jgi:uncharacterized protein (TIGR03437 family)
VAPGELVALFGSGLGPEQGVAFAPDSAGRVPTLLADTRVLIDGAPAPLLYVQSRQVNAVVPYQVQGKSSVSLAVQYRGQTTATMILPVTSTDPRFFRRDGSGFGPGAILNQDGSFNSPSNPAKKGSIISLWGTGMGQTDPPGIDGTITGFPLPRQVLGLRVAFGQPPFFTDPGAEVLYMGPAPALPAGVFQLNVRIPSNAPSGNAELEISLLIGNEPGGMYLPAGFTVAIE